MGKATVLFIGRWQPFHQGHKALIDSELNKGNNVIIALRDTDCYNNNNNPYTITERILMIKKVYTDACVYPVEARKARILIMAIPDLTDVAYGRKVGWGIKEIRLDKKTESISATKIRKGELKNETNSMD